MQAVLTRKNTITQVAYKDDPTIFAWELMNEPRSQHDNSGKIIQVLFLSHNCSYSYYYQHYNWQHLQTHCMLYMLYDHDVDIITHIYDDSFLELRFLKEIGHSILEEPKTILSQS